MEEVEESLRQLIGEVGHVIDAAEESVNVIVPLHYLASLIRGSASRGRLGGLPHRECQSRPSLQALEKISAVCLKKALMATHKTSPETVLYRAFYSGPCFPAVAQLLLHKVAVDWLACFSLVEQTVLFDDFFTHAPFAEAVTILVHALSGTQVFEEEENSSAVDSLDAAQKQAERLLVLMLISNEGVKNLAFSFSSLRDNVTQEEEGGGHPNGILSYRQNMSRMAQMLSSVPDRARRTAPPALQSPFYIQSVVSQLLIAAEENWIVRSYGCRSQVSSGDDETLKFVGEVIGKLCRRGHADMVASQVVPSLLQHLVTPLTHNEVEPGDQQSSWYLEQVYEKLQMSMWPSLAPSLSDSHAMEQFSEALLKRLAIERDVTDWQAHSILHTIFGELLTVRATTRSLFTEKFLFGKVLPIRCLKWVLNFAILCSPPAEEGYVKCGKTESPARKDAVRHLAEAWAERDFIQAVPLQQQAYITAAVGICLGSLNKAALEGINGLVASLLKGISNRLDSPLVPVREMAKRIALAFSRAVDLGSPLLFDEEDTIEDLLNWERLDQVARQVSNNSDFKVGGNEVIGKLQKDSNETHKDVLICHDEKVQRQDRQESRRAKKEKLELEEDDPDAMMRLGETVSDESEENSESDGESDSTLQPYDMSDDEADAKREKPVIHLADIATRLRKGDKPDEVEEALLVAQKLVLAAPEELDSVAAELAHALVHVKCSAIVVEGEEDKAEERRRKALVALLSCSPLQAVSVLTTELFSQHIDVSQRILILDVMKAGAKALASGTDGNKSLNEDTGVRLITDRPGITDHRTWYLPGGDSRPSGASPWVEVTSTVPGSSGVGWAHRYERELPLRQDQRPLGRSRIWGQHAMQLRENEKRRDYKQSQTNKFAPLAAAFMLPVMCNYDRRRQHLELLGRDFLVLGEILSMLGVCIQCVSMHPEAAMLGAGLLDMLRTREISSHSEIYVRRSALFAASCVLVALHPFDVVASLTGPASGIVVNLEWVRQWADEIAMNDVDTQCSMMATACLQLHAEMALQVQRAIGSAGSQILEAKIQSTSSIIMPF